MHVFLQLLSFFHPPFPSADGVCFRLHFRPQSASQQEKQVVDRNAAGQCPGGIKRGDIKASNK